MSFEPLSENGYLIDYSDMQPGTPAGDRHIIVCAKCSRPGLAHGRRCLHIVRYVQSPSGVKTQTVALACSGGAPKPAPEVKTQTGLPWCPKEWL